MSTRLGLGRGSGLKTVGYMGVIPLLVEGMKAQQRPIEAQQALLESQQAEIDALGRSIRQREITS